LRELLDDARHASGQHGAPLGTQWAMFGTPQPDTMRKVSRRQFRPSA
jgi:hypothetical protein